MQVKVYANEENRKKIIEETLSLLDVELVHNLKILKEKRHRLESDVDRKREFLKTEIERLDYVKKLKGNVIMK